MMHHTDFFQNLNTPLNRVSLKLFRENICDVLRDVVPFVQFKKREKHPWKSVTFSKVVGLACNFTKNDTSSGVFFTFFKL